MKQLIDATGLPRDRIRGVKRFADNAASGYEPVFEEAPIGGGQLGKSGRSSNIFRLGPTGAALLRAAGQQDAGPCGLKSERSIHHATTMLYIDIAAKKAGLAVKTDRELRDEDGFKIRPDHQITLADGSLALFEAEQDAFANYMPRIIDSLQHKLELFSKGETDKVSPLIRVVFNIRRGTREWNRTLNLWKQACGILESENGALPFRLVGIPLNEFVTAPDFGSQPAPERWEEITPAEEGQMAVTPSQPATGKARPTAHLPASLSNRITHEDHLIINALWHWFQENAARLPAPYPQPNPEFFETMMIIYAASHCQPASLSEQAAIPWASLFLLKEYLKLHPVLRELLNRTIKHSETNMRWNPTTILHRMQVVLNVFLAYHGWRSDGWLSVQAEAPSWEGSSPRTFFVSVCVRQSKMLQNGADLMLSEEEARQIEKALAWVFYALFAYAPDLNLCACGFW